MPKFKYTATDTDKKSYSGTMEANDKSVVIAQITSKGWRPISVVEASARKKGDIPLPAFLQRAGKVKSDDIVMFTRQLSAMISAGVPLLRAINSLQKNSESKALQAILADVSIDIQGGSQLADSLEKHPGTFSDIYINMVRAGEAAGILDDILKRLALQQEKNATMRKKIKSAMTYPIVLLVITIGAFLGLMLFVIPQIGNIIKDLGGPDAKLPVLTQVMLGISDVIVHFWFIVLPIVGVAVWLLMRWLKTPKGTMAFHRFILKVPGVNGIVTKVAVARFARTFSALMGAGVAVLEALSVTGRALGNKVFEQAITEAAEAVKNGDTLSETIATYDIFPAIVPQMLAVGEETGQTDTVLVKVADFYEEEVDSAIDGISSIIEPFMIVLMGGMVGLIAASVMMPIANLSNSISG